MGTDQFREVTRPQKENERLMNAGSRLTLDKLILAETARGPAHHEATYARFGRLCI